MPASSKRSQRTRRARDPSPNPPVAEQSSPSRPAKRRRKVEEPPSEPIEDEGSSLTIDPSGPEPASDDDSLITQVTQHLRHVPTAASEKHANSIHTSEDIEAYAKISAQDWTYYIKNLTINIGRNPDNTESAASGPDDEDYVHINLGPNKTFSRQTAVIYFDSSSEKWFIQARGRNGLKVDNEILRKSGPPHPLVSGEVIEIGGLEMMFVLPGNFSPLRINPIYLQQAGLRPPSRDARTALPPHPPAGLSSSQAVAAPSSSHGQSFQQLAPAPPDYKRPGTPSSAKSRLTPAPAKTPAQNSAGTMVMSQGDVDLSSDENRHIKPAFSYAQLITQAIMSTTDEKLNLSNIYGYITDHYAYYRHQPPNGWQNSIRHNLSLNKAFNKAPRSTSEPGKGMKWEFMPECREDMIRAAYKGGRGGHRGSSAPSSPSQVNQMTYITSGPRDMANKEPGSARKRKISPKTSPAPRSSLKQHKTPDRRHLSTSASTIPDGSPMPRSSKRAQAQGSFDGSFDADLPRSPPTLSSSYLQDEGASFVTPAPHRVRPRLAPPSTAQRPSINMPESSPAPFWKYADTFSTPLRREQYDSPLKPISLRSRFLPNSSSPPRAAPNDESPVGSPTKPGRPETPEKTTVAEEEDEEEEGGFDLTKGFPSISGYHALIGRGGPAPRANGGRA